MVLYQTTVGIGVGIGKIVFTLTWKILRMVKNCETLSTKQYCYEMQKVVSELTIQSCHVDDN